MSGPGTGPRLLTSMNADLTIRWQVELASRDQNIKFYYNTIPWVANGRVFVQANDGLHCFDAHATEATELWHRPSIRIPLRSAGRVFGDVVVIQDDNHVLGLDVVSGETQWTYTSKNNSNPEGNVAAWVTPSGTYAVCSPSSAKEIICLNPEDGSVVWVIQHGDSALGRETWIHDTVSIHDGYLAHARGRKGHNMLAIYRLNSDQPTAQPTYIWSGAADFGWLAPFPNSGVFYQGLHYSGFASSSQSRAVCLDPETGQQHWAYNGGGAEWPGAQSGRKGYGDAVIADGKMYGQQSKRVIWIRPDPSDIHQLGHSGKVGVQDQTVVTITQDGRLYVLCDNGSTGDNAHVKCFDLTPQSNVSPTIVQQALRSGKVGVYQEERLWVSGGNGLRSWSVSAGALPAGLSIDNQTHLLSGTPTQAGTYQLTLTATDGDAVSKPFTLEIANGQVSDNNAPSVDAGADQVAFLPAASIMLAGSVSDDGLPGSALLTTWSSAAGNPGPVNFTDPSNLTTTASFSVTGTYELLLVADDGELTSNDSVIITVGPEPVNQPPVVDAGAELNIFFPDDAHLNAVVSDDGLPDGMLTASWSMISGPGSVVFADGSQANTTASFSHTGTYQLELTVSDGELSSSDTVRVTVSDPPIGGAVVIALNAGGVAYTALDGTSYIADSGFYDRGWSGGGGAIAGTEDDAVYQKKRSHNQSMTYAIPVANGDYVVTLQFAKMGNSNPTAIDVNAEGVPVVNNLDLMAVAGLRVAYDVDVLSTVTDGELTLVLKGEINGIVVRSAGPAENQAPLVDAGDDQSIALPGLAQLAAMVSDDGLPSDTLTYDWSAVSGPGGVSFAASDQAATMVSFSEVGVHELQVTVSDGQYATSDSLIVTVTEPPVGDELIIALNAGGVAYTAVDGTHYVPDTGYYDRGWVGGGGHIEGTEDITVYQKKRSHHISMLYSIPIPNGDYALTLQFAKMGNSNPTAIDISAEGVPVVTDLDLMAVAGLRVAHDVEVLTTVTDGTLNLEIIGEINGIVVRTVPVAVGGLYQTIGLELLNTYMRN
ncbi:MAG: PQQ-binding-like beta-propeller repeat protein [Planctomycetes bacterium]|nr:PQQ-binding-like beta-propeller repeat protein [Planctomycetota bacterium]